MCAKWQWNALDWCYWIAPTASPVVQSSNTVSCISLSFRTHPYVPALSSMCPQTNYSLVQRKARRIFATKPSSIHIFVYCLVDSWKYTSVELLSKYKSHKMSLTKVYLKMSSTKCRPFYNGLDALYCVSLHSIFMQYKNMSVAIYWNHCNVIDWWPTIS